TASDGGNVERIEGNGSILETSRLFISPEGGEANGVVISNGARVAGLTNLVIGDSGYVTNYLSGYSGGLDLQSNCEASVSGKIRIVYTRRKNEAGVYWGLRWGGDHTAELEALKSAGYLEWDDSALGPFDRGQTRIYYDSAETNTYVGYKSGADGTMWSFY
ncbi:MAG: hypothetical protein PHP98_00690, partial [Kiritimatiellae bacterium]|nr:hypothetical protein [Kiritimatiellia bacterium]